MLHVPGVLFGGYEMHANIFLRNLPINDSSWLKWFFMSYNHVSQPKFWITLDHLCNIIKKHIWTRADTSSSSSSQEADTDDQQGTLTYEEFSVFYKMMSLRRDLFLLMMAYSDRKDHLTPEELANFLRNEQKVGVCWHSTIIWYRLITAYWNIGCCILTLLSGATAFKTIYYLLKLFCCSRGRFLF